MGWPTLSDIVSATTSLMGRQNNDRERLRRQQDG